MAQAMTEGVYAIDMVKGHRSIVSYKIATVHPLRHLRCHLPLHRGGKRLAWSFSGIRAGGACRRPYKTSPFIFLFLFSSLFPLLFSLKNSPHGGEFFLSYSPLPSVLLFLGRRL